MKTTQKDPNSILTALWKKCLVEESVKEFLRKYPDGKPPSLQKTQPKRRIYDKVKIN